MKVKKRNERKGSEGLGILVFSFLSKGVPREKTVTRERGFFL